MPTTKRKLKMELRNVIESVSIAPPAVRTVLVAACWSPEEDEGKSDARVIPVLAIQASIIRQFRRHPDGDKRSYSKIAARLEEEGFFECDRTVEHDYLIIDPEIPGEIGPASSILEFMNGFFIAVVCTWPPDQDNEMLACWKTHALICAKEKAESYEAQVTAERPKVP